MGSGIPSDEQYAKMLVRLRTGWALAFAQLQLRLKDGTIVEGAVKRALAFLASLVPAAAAQAAALVLAGGTVIDGYGNPPIPDGIIVIEGDRILAVGGVGQVAIPEGAQVISTEGMTVLPGLWDMQVSMMRLGHGDSARWNETYGPLAERRRDADRGAPAPAGGRHQCARHRSPARCGHQRPRPRARASHRRPGPLRLRAGASQARTVRHGRLAMGSEGRAGRARARCSVSPTRA